jgi:hypothetical protein
MKINEITEALEIEEGDGIDIKLPDGRIISLALEPTEDEDSLPELELYLPAIMTVNVWGEAQDTHSKGDGKTVTIPIEKIGLTS